MFKWIRSLWVRFWFSVQMAWHGILSNPLRSALTILGVAIGVASVVSLMGIGEGARQAVVNQFKSLGANVIVVKAEDPSAEFEADFATQLQEMVPQLQEVTPVVYGEVPVCWRRERGLAQLVGVNSKFPEIRDHPVVSGHFFSNLHIEQRSPVFVLVYNLAAGLLRGLIPVGQTLTLDGLTFRIIGVLAPKGPNQAEGIDDKFIIPYTTALQLAKKKTVSEIWESESALDADLATVQLGDCAQAGMGTKALHRLPARMESPGCWFRYGTHCRACQTGTSRGGESIFDNRQGPGDNHQPEPTGAGSRQSQQGYDTSFRRHCSREPACRRAWHYEHYACGRN